MAMSGSAHSLVKAVGLARISKIVPQIPDGTPSPFKGALLGALLPSLHYLAIVGSLDETLTEFIKVKSIPWPKKMKEDLFHRIDVVAASSPGLDSATLHRLRERRNQIAHEPETIMSAPVTWVELDSAIDLILRTVQVLELVHDIPDVTAVYERKSEIFPNELGPNGERLRHKHSAEVRCDGVVIMEFAQDVSYLPP
jgi:hypothetical protein